ncbi:Predicted dehydrogenase [Halovenus aranensis]|uniref:Predicted dehydrogenase n=1 Tax=Halovenus aranensis TaxID=890420 RepID=A0A1G8RRU5_9EURY|nr:Gfo/Idh/MocA family oxidoreductase [Halovenus aranensis]SDJ19711.1 Predicted dehydrogenase [Halovenus aranensis]
MNIGVISTANIGRKRVIPAIQKTGATVRAIASRDGARAEEVANEFDIPDAYGSYEEMLDSDSLDAVYNPLPNSLHAEWTKRAADAGLDVLCEKPLAVDADQAREMVEYCAGRGVTLMEAFMYRYHPRTERAVEIADTYLGEIRRVDAQFHFPLPDRYNVRLDPDLAGGSLMDVGCYAVTAARLFLGEPESAYATAVDRRDCGVETSMTGLLQFAGGRTATISAGFDESVHRYTVLGTDGRLDVDRAFVPDGETTLRYTVDGRTVEETFDPVDQYQLEVEAFIEAVESGDPPRTDGEDAIETLRVVDALYESVERGEPASL